MTMSCPCCGNGAVEPLYGCCESCATNAICRRCVACGTWYHDHPHTHGLVSLGPDNLPRCANGCPVPV
ncbi:MAG TPA: hypothetical protein VF426_06060 [Marmoricola sp.]